MLNAFYIFVYALAVPVYSVLDYFCRNACNDHVRFVESFGHNASPAYDAVVGNAYVFADFDIFAYPYVASYFDAFSVVDGNAVKVCDCMRICAPYVHSLAQLAVITDADM